VNNYTITVGNSSTNLGKVGNAKTIVDAKRIGRAAVHNMLPNGEGNYQVRDITGQRVVCGERSIRTAYKWNEV